MACIAAGMAQTRSIVPFVGTFLGFVDYMRNAHPNDQLDAAQSDLSTDT